MKGKLVLVQLDHVSGETMGFAINRLSELGAKNVQLLQSITKKNRPGYVLLIDLPADKLSMVSLFLAQELGIWGYHVMDSEHVHFDISFRQKKLFLKGSGFNEEEMPFKVKYISDQGRLVSITVEHDFLVNLHRFLQERGCSLPISGLRSSLEAKLWSESGDGEVIELDLGSLHAKTLTATKKRPKLHTL